MKLIADITADSNGEPRSRFYCLAIDDQTVLEITHTLLSFVKSMYDLWPRMEEAIALQESGQYTTDHPDSSDFSINDVELWLRPPMAQPGHVCISTDYTEAYSVEHGQPQQFTYEQFRAAMTHWHAFQERITKEGKESMVGQRFEAPWPEANG